MSVGLVQDTGFAGCIAVDASNASSVSVHPHALRQKAQRASLETGNHPGQSMPIPMLPSTRLSDEGLPDTSTIPTGEVADQNRKVSMVHPDIPWNLVIVLVAAGLVVYSANLNV